MFDLNDPIIKTWTYNYNTNLENKEFSKVDSKPLSFLKNNNTYSNVPVVLVAAGPSIDKNIKILKNFQKNAIILAVDVVLFKLLECDIIPDFVVNIDPSDMFVRFFDDLDTKNLTLICPTSVNPKVLDAWEGRKFFFNQEDLKHTAKGKALKKITKSTKGFGDVFNRFFIGATMTQIASTFNPKSITLIGFDFAFTDGKAYCDGFLDRKIYDDTTEEGSEEHTNNIKILKENEVNTDVTEVDVYGKTTHTSTTLKFYHTRYLDMIQKELRIKNIINATEGGILKEIQRLELSKALEIYCNIEIDKKDSFILKKRKRRKK